VFFGAGETGRSRQLWKTDGTQMVKDIVPGPSGAGPTTLTNVNGTLFFVAYDSGGVKRALWKSDGTEVGTVLVDPSETIPVPAGMIDINGQLFFGASRLGEFGSIWSIWKSDGTAAGTTLVKDIEPGVVGTTSYRFTNVNGTLYFIGRDSATGSELWRSDGTAAGTQMLQDIAPGPIPSNPERFAPIGTHMYFLADDYGHGRELWSMPLPLVAPQQIIPPNGGVLTLPNLTLQFPPNAVTTPITITYAELVEPTQPLGGAQSAGHSFLLEARDQKGHLVT
jgi:ELWxxDGT repeat protein